VQSERLLAPIAEQTYQAIAKPITDEDCDPIQARWVASYPQFREYQEKMSRVTPVIETAERVTVLQSHGTRLVFFAYSAVS
jgi:hypothetical protein